MEATADVSWSDKAHRRLAAWVGNPWFWITFIGLGMALPIVRSVRAKLPPPLPVLGTLPEFRFTNQYGQPFGSQELKGQVWIANFIFTRCPTVCPRFTE